MATQKVRKNHFDDEGDYERLVKRDLGRKRKHRRKKTKVKMDGKTQADTA